MDMTVGEIAQLVGGAVHGDAETRITGLNGLKEAGKGDLCFVRSARYLPDLLASGASAALVRETPPKCAIPLILVENPDEAFANLLEHFRQQQARLAPGVHPSAAIASSAEIAPSAAVGASTYIGEEAVVGEGVQIHPGVYIGRGARIGRDTILYPNVCVREGSELGARCIIHANSSIGSDGFGFTNVQGRWVKIPQVGGVQIGDDVEIGSNSAVDRGTFGMTRIGRGVKIDNLVQIGHNVQIGDDSVIAGTVGIAGSAIIGSNVRVGANSGIKGHLTIGDGATIAARSGVVRSVAPGATVSGFPNIDHGLDRRVMVLRERLPELARRVRQLEREIEHLKEKEE